MSQTRRVLIASALALAAVPAWAADKKSVEVGKAFPYLENYWKLPAGERSRFAVVYYLKRDGRPAAGLKGAIVMGATRIPVSISATGRVAPLPTLAQIRGGAKIEFDVPAETRFSMSMQIEPTARPAVEMSAPDLRRNLVGARAFARAMTATPPDADWYEETVAALMRLPAYVRRAMGGEQVGPDCARITTNEDLAARLTLPMLVVTGARDALSDGTVTAAAYRAKFPAARVFTYPEAGHSPFAEDAARFNADLEAFVNATRTAPPSAD